jgi:hypothetical protein
MKQPNNIVAPDVYEGSPTLEEKFMSLMNWFEDKCRFSGLIRALIEKTIIFPCGNISKLFFGIHKDFSCSYPIYLEYPLGL